MIDPQDITGLILAGGRGQRMGGIDKGLQPFQGQPLAWHALQRLTPQVGVVMLNANRNLSAYESFGVPVWSDASADFAGPLSGFLSGLDHCDSAYLLTVPCDCPLFPLNLAARLAQALRAEDADMAMAAAPETDENGHARLRTQPVFCLMKTRLRDSLASFIQNGGRKVGAWTAQHHTVVVPFDADGDDRRAFCNINTPQELHALEQPL